MSATTKMKIYRCSVRSTLTYACETWPPTQKQERRLSVCDRRLKYQPKPVRPIGHPTNRFQDTLKLDCSRAGPDYRLQNIETVAADRTQWRKFVRAATGDG